MSEISEPQSSVDSLAGLVPGVVPEEGVDPELVTVGERYWALAGFDEDSGAPVWCEKASAIDVSVWKHQLYVVAAAGVRAVVPGRSCPRCGGQLSLTSRTAFQQLCNGTDQVCVECSESLLSSVRLVLDPGRKAKGEAAQAKQQVQQKAEDARARWRQQQREKVDAKYAAIFPSDKTPPAAGVREQVTALALLRYTPLTTPVAEVDSWPDPLHPDHDELVDLLSSLVRARLLKIASASPVAAFEWKPTDFDSALQEAGGDLDAVPAPELTDRFYPLKASYYVPYGPSAGTAAERLDAQLTAALDPSRMTEAAQNTLVEVTVELIVEEALRYFAGRLQALHLPAVPEGHQARLKDAVGKLAEHRALGEIYNLAWQATRAAAEAAQKNPRAPRAHMSTHAVNKFESLAQRAATDPGWDLKVFTEAAGQGPAAMTRVLFYTILRCAPMDASLPQIVQNLPDPLPETPAHPADECGQRERPAVPDGDDEHALTIAWLKACPDGWDPQVVPRALETWRTAQEQGSPWHAENKVIARGAAHLQLLHERLSPVLGAQDAALAVLGATSLLHHPLSAYGSRVPTNGAWLFQRLSSLLLGLPDESESPQEEAELDTPQD